MRSESQAASGNLVMNLLHFGYSLQEAGIYDEAEPCFGRALEILVAAFGPDGGRLMSHARFHQALLQLKVGDYDAVVPTLSGQAWITGFAQYVVDPEDPFPNGFTVGDIWGKVDDR